MKSEVYFSDFHARNPTDNKQNKIKRIFQKLKDGINISEDDLVALKLHFGEEGNDSFLSPLMVQPFVQEIKNMNAKPFLTDTNTLYDGSRHNAINHIQIALKHGFGFTVVEAPLIIADGLRGENGVNITINLKHFDEVKIASEIVHSDALIVISHFKGHAMSGFGGAIKNLSMGCATLSGKMQQHQIAQPFIDDNCTACGDCESICRVQAISIDDKALIDYEKCMGCNECINSCPEMVINLNQADLESFMESMAEYAYGATRGKEGKLAFINFLMNITPDCDCEAFSDMPVVPDIGILASHDPIALDKASFDLVNRQMTLNDSLLETQNKDDDIFKSIWNVNGLVQIIYGEKIGLGNSKYKLIKV